MKKEDRIVLDYRLTVFDQDGIDVYTLQFSEAEFQTRIGHGEFVPVNGDTYRWGFLCCKLKDYKPYQFESINSKAIQC